MRLHGVKQDRAGYSPLVGLLIDLGQMQVIYSNTQSDVTH